LAFVVRKEASEPLGHILIYRRPSNLTGVRATDMLLP
jgi:hypothetical protein